LSAKVNADAVHIHQLTEQLDQARLQVDSTSARLVSVTQEDQAAIAKIGATRGILLDQALRAYMHGGISLGMSTSQSADVTISQEYLTVASGDLANTGDQLRQMDETLRTEQVNLRNAQQQKGEATAQLQALRTSALAAATSDQVHLESLQVQLAAQAQAEAAQAAASGRAAGASTASPATQGLPVNNGLVAVVQQAAGVPIVKPVSAVASATTGNGNSGGGGAGGVWLQLRTCESGDNYAENTGNGYYGAYQFSQSTWNGLGYPGRPDEESPGSQDDAAMKLQAASGWGQWPACAAALGLT
jgi:membrane protease subunit (stomatin/prohibitin family)